MPPTIRKNAAGNFSNNDVTTKLEASNSHSNTQFRKKKRYEESDDSDLDDILEKISFAGQPGEIEGTKQSKITSCKPLGQAAGLWVTFKTFSGGLITFSRVV